MITKQQIIIIFGLIALSVISIFLFISASKKIDGIRSDVKDNINQTPIKIEQAVDQEVLTAEYLKKSQDILNSYFSTIEKDDANLANLSASTQSELLNLTLPFSQKEKHLAQVLLLGEIADLENEGKHQSALNKLNQLKELTAKQ